MPSSDLAFIFFSHLFSNYLILKLCRHHHGCLVNICLKNFNWKLNFAKLEEIIQSLSAKLCEADGRQAAEISSGGYSKQKETSSPDSGSQQTCVKLIPNEKLIPTVIVIRIENEEDFNIIMDKIPEYGVVDEEVIQTFLAM